MHRVIVKEALWLLFWSLLALVLGSLVGYPLTAVALLLLGYLALSLFSAHLFLCWVIGGRLNEPPNLLGYWQVMGRKLYDSRRRQMRATRNIRKTFHRIAQLTHAIDEGIVILDGEFHLEWWNRSAERLLGLQAQDRGLELTGLIRNPKFLGFLEQSEYLHVLELPAKQNPNQWLSFAAYRFGDGEIVLVIADITRMKKAELMRKDFVGNVSHELRTPLTVLRGYLETLVDGGMVDNPRALKAFDQMREQVLRMQAMADDLIILSKLDSHPETPDKPLENIQLRELFDKLVEEAQVVSEGRHEFHVSCPDDLSLRCEPVELHSALGNLVINAVRHNPPGTLITLKAEKVGDNLDVHVIDNGVGISAEIIPRLTERFYRADSSRNSSKGGTGLGLAIVKHIVNRYSGQLLISSKLGSGSDFLCRFPLPRKGH